MAWTTSIYNRTLNDVLNRTSKGFINTEDLNRIVDNLKFVYAKFTTKMGGYPYGYKDMPTYSDTSYIYVTDVNNIINNINILKEVCDASVLTGWLSVNEFIGGSGGTNPTWESYNAIEKNIEILYNVLDSQIDAASNSTVATSFGGGTGTQEDPYLITNAGELAYLSVQVDTNGSSITGKYFKQTKNISLNYWFNWCNYRIGAVSAGKYFTGAEYDGGNKYIGRIAYNMNNDNGYQADYGIFGISYAKIINVNVVASYVMNSSQYNTVNNFGVVVANQIGNYIDNCKSTAMVNTFSGNLPIHFLNTIGGIVGRTQSGADILNCKSDVELYIKAEGNPVTYGGGILGDGTSNITNCIYKGKVTSDFGDSYGYAVTYFGAIFGHMSGDRIVSNCSFEPNEDDGPTGVYGYFGGIGGIAIGIDSNNKITINNCKGIFLLKDAQNSKYGGIIGSASTYVDINQCYFWHNNQYGVIESQFGGMVHMVSGTININNCFTMFGKYNGGYIKIAGFVANQNSGSVINIDKCYTVYQGGGGGGYRDPFITGDNIATSTISVTNSYYDNEYYTGTTSYGTGQPTSNMRLQTTYTSWDFANIWGIDEYDNAGFPYLLNT